MFFCILVMLVYLFLKVFILQGKKGKTEIFKINKRNTLWRKSRNQSDQNMKKTKLRKWDEPDITVNTKMLHWVNCLLINLFVQSYNPILNLRILNIFHEICYLFWSAQKLENQNLNCNCLFFIKKANFHSVKKKHNSFSVKQSGFVVLSDEQLDMKSNLHTIYLLAHFCRSSLNFHINN